MKENIDSGCMILFVKAPAVGRVKTRLAESIGGRAALFLYRAFVEDILDAISATDLRLRIFYYPPEDGGLVRRWIGGGPRLFAQQGDDLGARMHDAFCRTAQEGFERIVLAGSDIPEIDESIIKAAFSALETHPAVIGPAEDGGYYLVGLRAESVCRQVFSGIDWGTDRVLDQSLERFGGPACKHRKSPQAGQGAVMAGTGGKTGQGRDKVSSFCRSSLSPARLGTNHSGPSGSI
ncbi:MAG: TIGR04282 family arsenosugar biosynthesis glycosyltransferase [Desulfosalsimonas sp.]